MPPESPGPWAEKRPDETRLFGWDIWAASTRVALSSCSATLLQQSRFRSPTGICTGGDRALLRADSMTEQEFRFDHDPAAVLRDTLGWLLVKPLTRLTSGTICAGHASFGVSSTPDRASAAATGRMGHRAFSHILLINVMSAATDG